MIRPVRAAVILAVILLAACSSPGKAAPTVTASTAGPSTSTTVGLSDAATTWCAVPTHERALVAAARTLGIAPTATVDLLVRGQSVAQFWAAWAGANADPFNLPTYPVPGTIDEQNVVVQFGPTEWWSASGWPRVCGAAFGARG